MIRRSRLFAFLLSVLLAAGLISPAPAGATNLWRCSPFPGDIMLDYVCTTVRAAPSTGIHVLDRATGYVVTWYNGTSVVLSKWAWDNGSSCGVNGDHYVWKVAWYSGGRSHWGVLGDWWLDTGSASEWSDWTDSRGRLGDQYAGSGSGACNSFTPTPNGW